MTETVLIIGGGLAGASAAETLRSEGFDGRVLIAGEESAAPYDRPPLSKDVLRGERAADATGLHDEAWYTERQIEVLTGTRVQQIDRRERAALAGGALIPFNVALIATGATPRALEIPGALLPGVHLLRTHEQAAAIAASLRPGAQVVIVGGGFIGCEVAASARSVGCDVTIIEPLGSLLERALGARIGDVIATLHRAQGVVVRTKTGVTAFEGDTQVRRVVLTDGASVDADVVVVGIGVTPNVDLAQEAEIGCHDGILVDALCRTSAAPIYAAGDCARREDPLTGEQMRVEHWDNAVAQGAAAARAMLGKTEPFVHVPWFWSDQYEHPIQMSGHAPRWDRIVTRGDLAAGDGLAWYLDGDRLRAVMGIGRNRDVRAARMLLEFGVTPSDGELADESYDVRAAGRAAKASA